MTTASSFGAPSEIRSGVDTYSPVLGETSPYLVSLTNVPETLSIRTGSSIRKEQPRLPTQMIESLSVNNFRGFKHLELHGLSRINVVVGQNASGKSALLESIGLATAANPEFAIRLNVIRGFAQPLQISLERSSYESLWRYLFFGYDQHKVISIELVGAAPNTRSLMISYREQESLVLPLGNAVSDSPFIVPITFEWRDSGREPYVSQPTISKEGLTLPGVSESMPGYFFSSTYAYNAGESANRFSELDREGKANVVVDALRSEFPHLRDISIQVVSGTPTLHASVQGAEFKVPLGLLSGGINKLMAVLLAVALRPHGVILVDEIENGFHYEHFRSIWSMLLRICKEQNTQVFASTHSQECLNAALPTVRENEKDFSLIRTELKDGHCTARAFGGREFHSAVEQNIEVR